jgi:hypothetical protein
VPTGTPPPPLKLTGTRIVNAHSGEPVDIKGINW